MATKLRPTTVAEYLAAAPADKRAALTKLRRSIKAAAPKAVEGLAYGLIAYKYNGRPLTYIGYAKQHCALYGYSSFVHEHPELFTRYSLSKGTVRFPPDSVPPDTLVKRMVRARMAEIDRDE
jgi:uncharacterized protein YdhG (YjbR/CyaY superfamily)